MSILSCCWPYTTVWLAQARIQRPQDNPLARLAQVGHLGPITEQGPLAEPLRGKPARNMEPEVGLEDRPFCLQDDTPPQGLPLEYLEKLRSGVIGA